MRRCDLNQIVTVVETSDQLKKLFYCHENFNILIINSEEANSTSANDFVFVKL